MFYFILQTLIWALLATLLGYLVGRLLKSLLKKLFCKALNPTDEAVYLAGSGENGSKTITSEGSLGKVASGAAAVTGAAIAAKTTKKETLSKDVPATGSGVDDDGKLRKQPQAKIDAMLSDDTNPDLSVPPSTGTTAATTGLTLSETNQNTDKAGKQAEFELLKRKQAVNDALTQDEDNAKDNDENTSNSISGANANAHSSTTASPVTTESNNKLDKQGLIDQEKATTKLSNHRQAEIDALMPGDEDSNNDSSSLISSDKTKGLVAGLASNKAHPDGSDINNKQDTELSKRSQADDNKSTFTDNKNADSNKTRRKPNVTKNIAPDNLQIIEGIGPAMEKVLKENGITSLNHLGNISDAELQAILDKYGDKYKIIKPHNWAAEARLAADGDIEGLIAAQKADGSPSKAEGMLASANIAKPENASGTTTGGSGNIPHKLDQNDIQLIEGIGPAMQKVLNDSGIYTFADLSKKSTTELQSILNKYGNKYQVIDPAEWVYEAMFAANNKIDELIAAQKADGSPSKLENKLASDNKSGFASYKKDDLQIIEGIGPKICGLLNQAGINTWGGLAQTSISKIQEVLDAAGASYQMADPTTWPEQAGLAAAEKWAELKEYQDFLDKGKA